MNIIFSCFPINVFGTAKVILPSTASDTTANAHPTSTATTSSSIEQGVHKPIAAHTPQAYYSSLLMPTHRQQLLQPIITARSLSLSLSIHSM